MIRFKEVAHDVTHKDPRWRLFCDQVTRYRLVIELEETFTQRDIDKIEDSIGAALHDLHRKVANKFSPK